MAKKKKESTAKQAPLSPEKFMRTKARQLPIDKCYYIPGWEESGMTTVIVSRANAQGRITFGAFLLDTFCLGVKDAYCNVNREPEVFEEMLEGFIGDHPIEELSYDEAHNLVYGAIAYAEEGGISPHRDFDLAGYILEEDTDDIPLIEYEFGRKGKHCLIINPGRREAIFEHTLRNKLGDNLEVVDLSGGESMSAYDLAEDLAEDFEEKMFDEPYESEPYTYVHPEYPTDYTPKYPEIISTLEASKSLKLPKKLIERINSVPADELAEDLGNFIMHIIATTYSRRIKPGDESERCELIHACALLVGLNTDKALDAVLELMRQNEDFIEYHFGMTVFELLPSTLYACGRNNLQPIVDLLHQPGITTTMRSVAVDAITAVALFEPDRRAEVLDIFKGLLIDLPVRVQQLNAADKEFAASLVCSLIDLNATELLPDIKNLFDEEAVAISICGDWDEVSTDIKKITNTPLNNVFPDRDELYEHLQTLFR